MDNIVYIIIGVLWVVISLYNRSDKKKRASDQTGSSTKKPVADPITLLKELILEEVSPKSDREYVPVENTRTLRKGNEPPVITKQYNFRDEADGFFAEGEKTTRQNKINDTDEINTENFMDEFNLKKAVIYSEIMRAPYI